MKASTTGLPLYWLSVSGGAPFLLNDVMPTYSQVLPLDDTMFNSPIRQTRRGKICGLLETRGGGHCCQCTECIGARTSIGSACVRYFDSTVDCPFVHFSVSL